MNVKQISRPQIVRVKKIVITKSFYDMEKKQVIWDFEKLEPITSKINVTLKSTS